LAQATFEGTYKHSCRDSEASAPFFTQTEIQTVALKVPTDFTFGAAEVSEDCFEVVYSIVDPVEEVE